jgi:hypothetical protein
MRSHGMASEVETALASAGATRCDRLDIAPARPMAAPDRPADQAVGLFAWLRAEAMRVERGAGPADASGLAA